MRRGAAGGGWGKRRGRHELKRCKGRGEINRERISTKNFREQFPRFAQQGPQGA
jgi:hypothetical protein